MSSDDFIGPIALEPLSPHVPTSHVTLGVQHDDCVIDDAFDKQAESLFALPKRLFGFDPLEVRVAGCLGGDNDCSDQNRRSCYHQKRSSKFCLAPTGTLAHEAQKAKTNGNNQSGWQQSPRDSCAG